MIDFERMRSGFFLHTTLFVCIFCIFCSSFMNRLMIVPLITAELFSMSKKPICSSLVKRDHKLYRAYIFLCSFLQTLTFQLYDLHFVVKQIGI